MGVVAASVIVVVVVVGVDHCPVQIRILHSKEPRQLGRLSLLVANNWLLFRPRVRFRLAGPRAPELEAEESLLMLVSGIEGGATVGGSNICASLGGLTRPCLAFDVVGPTAVVVGERRSTSSLAGNSTTIGEGMVLTLLG